MTKSFESDILLNKENQQRNDNKEVAMKAVIYARYSCDNQREESIEGQLRECKQFADRMGFTLVDSYIDRVNVIGSYENEKFYKIRICRCN